MAQLDLEGMPRRLFSCTPTRLTTWLDCPRRYRFTYLDRPTPVKGPQWAHLSLGTSVHNALRAWWGQPGDRRERGFVVDLLTVHWQGGGYRDDEQESRLRAVATGWLTDYVSTQEPTDEPIGVERTVAVRTERLALSGRVDRIDERLGEDGVVEAVVVDYKTGRRPSTTDEARSSLALAVYALATERTLRRRCRQVELHHIPTGDVAVWRHDDQTLQRHVRRATEVADDAEGASEFPPQPGVMCGWCDYRAHCPEGQAAAPQRQPWDGLPDVTA